MRKLSKKELTLKEEIRKQKLKKMFDGYTPACKKADSIPKGVVDFFDTKM